MDEFTGKHTERYFRHIIACKGIHRKPTSTCKCMYYLSHGLEKSIIKRVCHDGHHSYNYTMGHQANPLNLCRNIFFICAKLENNGRRSDFVHMLLYHVQINVCVIFMSTGWYGIRTCLNQTRTMVHQHS